MFTADTSEPGGGAHGGLVYQAARKWGVPVESITDFSANINPDGPPRAIREMPPAIWRQIISYPDSNEFVGVLAEKLKVPADCIFLSNGSASIFFHIARALKVKRALLLEPCFGEYHRAMNAADIRVHSFMLSAEKGFLPDMDDLVLAAESANARLVILNSPHNPSGALYPTGDLLTFADRVSGSGTYVVIDHAFIDFVQEPPGPDNLIGRRNVIVIRSLTKFYAMPGLRIGYGLCHRDMAARLRSQVEAWPVSGPALWAAAMAIQDVEFERASRSRNARARREFESALKQIGLTVYPSAANFLLVQVPRPAKDLAGWLEPHRILIRRCESFKGLDDTVVRLAVKSQADNVRLVGLIRDWIAQGCNG